MLPFDFPNWKLVYYYFIKLKRDETFEHINEVLRDKIRLKANKQTSPSVALIDSQSVSTTRNGGGVRGVDGGKKIKGRKRHIITDTKVDLSTYTIVPYMSPNMKIYSDKLVEETIEYFKNYNLNGITGSLTLFGDLALNTACQVEVIDNRNPSKNSVYLVEEVTTTFGVQGYRQLIKIPYKIKK